MSETIGILAMQGGILEHERALQKCGVTTRLVRRATHLEGLDGLVLPGGESTTMSKLLTFGGLYQPLQELLDEGLPAFGTCAGMILLASTVENTRDDAVNFSAIDITVRRNAFGRQVDSFEADLDVTGIEGTVPAVFIRAPQVVATGDGVEILSTVPVGDHSGAVVAVRQGRVMAASFHPELTDDIRMHQLFIESCVRSS